MRGVGGIAAAVLAAVLIVVAGKQTEAAESDRLAAERFLFFFGADLWGQGQFSYGGLLWSPDAIDREGFAFKLLIGGGTYRYRSGALGDADVTGREISAAFLPGWRFQQGQITTTMFVGLDLQHHRLSPDDPSSGLRGQSVGVRAAMDVWYQPGPATMLELNASLSSIGPSYSVRGAVGWQIQQLFYIGPEIQGFAFDDNYRQLRFGLHITALKYGNFEWSAGIGWTTDSDDREGFYGRLGMTARR